ncbi:hypothetical protein [Kaistia terrae]|uniref:Uncharacterized protein n=1 Tax=Kaistia terrae TaxID=537017 RepID=A0ABW0PXR5_9HYPH|nr:hypothetical protein [Kaistia terrae]MCX5580786.1 hypothetical protein [Kaistia terrae]
MLPQKLERHRWFDDWRGAEGPALCKLVADITTALDGREQSAGTRTRKFREIDQRHHLSAVETTVANLAHAVLVPPETGRLAILTGNGRSGQTRYDNPALGKPFRTLLHGLDDLGLAAWRNSPQRREASSLVPTESFAKAVRTAGITLADFGRQAGEEVVIASRKTRHRFSDGLVVSRELVDYTDTAETIAIRNTVRGVNTFLGEADIAFIYDGHGPVDPHSRAMARHFTLTDDEGAPRFDRNGRLFGGFWQNLRKDRRQGIRIEGEAVANLDFSSMFPRLAYSHAGVSAPDGDLYAIPGLEGHRRAVKMAMNCLLMDDFHRSAWPKELVTSADDSDATAILPPGWTVKRTKDAILRKHPALRPCFGAGIGLMLMHTESQILIHVLEEMKAKKLVALGLHDGLLLPRSRAEEGRMMMEVASREVTCTSIPVTLKA